VLAFAAPIPELPSNDRAPRILGLPGQQAPRGRLLTDVFRPPNAALLPSAA
jgi:hypothetical protein